MRKRLGRTGADPEKVRAARRYLAQGMGVSKTAKLAGLETGHGAAAKAGRGGAGLSAGGGKELLVPHYHERRGVLPK